MNKILSYQYFYGKSRLFFFCLKAHHNPSLRRNYDEKIAAISFDKCFMIFTAERAINLFFYVNCYTFSWLLSQLGLTAL